MSRRSWILFLTLSALWGASYLFIKVGLEDGVPPAAIVFARLALAAAVLVPIAHLETLRGHGRHVVVLGLVQVAGPFLLITFGERELSSALTGILVATVPIFTFLLAFALRGEQRAGGLSLLGVGIGIAGVALLLGVDSDGTTGALVGGLMVVLASAGYAIGAWYLKRRMPGVDPVGTVAATMAASAVMVAPLLAFDPPSEVPGIDAVGALLGLGILGTGAAFVIFYALIETEGPARTSLVAYVAPAFALVYGVTILDEGFTGATAAGLLLIVSGSWLAAEGRLPWRLRGRAAPAPSGSLGDA